MRMEEIRLQMVQEAASTVARMAAIREELNSRLEALEQVVREQGETHERAISALIDLFAEHRSQVLKTLDNHEDRLRRLEGDKPAA